jgi:hypothetical protein
MAAKFTPAASASVSVRSLRTFDLSPEVNPPPWMKTMTGAGLSDFAFQKSSLLRSKGP